MSLPLDFGETATNSSLKCLFCPSHRSSSSTGSATEGVVACPSVLQQLKMVGEHEGDESYPSKASVGEEATGLGAPRGAVAPAAAIGGGGGIPVKGSGDGWA